MKYKISNKSVEGCDRYSHVYCKSYNALLPVMMPEDDNGSLSISDFEKMEELDRSALGLYIGKFVEQEINSSVVQLMRFAIGIDMPDYYCKPDSTFRDDIVESRHKKIRINESLPPKCNQLKTIALGDAYYALESLMDEDDSGFFEDYPWLSDNSFLSAWRGLFAFRNKVAHIGTIITGRELAKAYENFSVFLTFMPKIQELKSELAPEDQQFYEPEVAIDAFPIFENDNIELPKATAEDYARYVELENAGNNCNWSDDRIIEEMNDLMNNKNWFTQIFVGEDGKKGMKDARGKIIVPAIYDDYAFTYHIILGSRSTIIAVKDGKMGIVKTDGSGESTTGFIYDNLGYIKIISGAYFFRKGKGLSYGVVGCDGKEIIPCVIDESYEPDGTNFFYKNGNYWGLWQYMQGILLQPMYDNIEFGEELEDPLIFTLNGDLGYVNADKEFIPKKDVDSIEDEDERHDCLLEFLQGQYDLDS